MLLTITHLKAPWPQGAVVGDVIDLPSVPPWALGKCTAAPAGAVVTIAPQTAEWGNQVGDIDVVDMEQPIELQAKKRGRPRKDAQ